MWYSVWEVAAETLPRARPVLRLRWLLAFCRFEFEAWHPVHLPSLWGAINKEVMKCQGSCCMVWDIRENKKMNGNKLTKIRLAKLNAILNPRKVFQAQSPPPLGIFTSWSSLLKTSRSAETVIKIMIKQNPMKARVSLQFEPCGQYKAHGEKATVEVVEEDVGDVNPIEAKAWVVQSGR